MLKVFDFVCPKCGKKEEKIVKATDMVICSACETEMTKMLSAPAFHLKGSGWAKDNYGLAKKDAKT